MELCRICAKCDFGIDETDDAKWLDLFHPVACQNEMQDIRLELDIWKLQINPNDGLPQKICIDCFKKFRTIHAMRLECQEAQEILKNIFQSMETQSERDFNNSSIDFKLSTCRPPIICQIDNESSQYANDHNYIRKCSKKVARKQLLNICNSSNSESADKFKQPLSKDTKFLQLTSLPNVDEYENIIHETSKESNDGSDQNDLVINETAVISDTTIEVEPLSNGYIYITVDNNTENNLEKVTILRLSPIKNKTTDQEWTTESTDEISTNTFECKYCYKSKEKPAEQFLSYEELLDHVSQYHDSVNPFECPHCNEKFPDAPSRTVHIKDLHVEKQYACDICGKKYAGRANVLHHIEKYHSKTDFKCDLCDKTFTTQKSLKHHSQWHIPDRQMKCEHCDRIFISKRLLKIHEATHTGIRNSEVCTFCGKSFFHVKTLRWHIYKNHGGQKPYKCTLCSEVFDSYKKKRLHMLENHAKHLTSEEKSQCMICNKNFPNATDLQNHMNNNHDESSVAIVNDKRVLQTKKEKQFSGVFQCEQCPQRFNLKSALIRHSAVHNIEGRPHACTECSKRYKRIQDLRWHMKTHSEEKPNVCDICGKGFALKYVLTQHRKSHEAVEKCFQCATCGRTYLFEKSLRLHERIHTGKTYYKCDLCGEKFVTHIKFLCHMRKMHTSNNNQDEQHFDEYIEDVISK